MTDMNGESTVLAKQAFECLSRSYDVNILHYHCDNGLFDTSKVKSNNLILWRERTPSEWQS
jgi:hypothetical protein